MKVALAGQGAFGIKHLEAMANIPGIEVVTLAGGSPASTEEVAKKWKIPHWTTDLGESLKQPGVEAVILTTPTQLHAEQAIQSMRAGKHVMVEIPMADTLEDSERIVAVQPHQHDAVGVPGPQHPLEPGPAEVGVGQREHQQQVGALEGGADAGDDLRVERVGEQLGVVV